MCIDISFHSDIQLTRDAFPGLIDKSNIQLSPEFSEQIFGIVFPPYNVIAGTDNGLELLSMEWGVIPSWIKDPVEIKKRRMKMLNIQSERIYDDKKSVWYRIKKNKILIPVDGIFEHREIKGWKKKVPYYVRPIGGEPFYIPGLYQELQTVDEDGVVHTSLSFGLITRPANTKMCNIHNSGDNKHRMPLFTRFDMSQAWISQSLQENEAREILSFEIPDDDLECYPVYSIRGNVLRPDGKHKYEPWDWPGLPPLGDDMAVNPQKKLF